jgi:hypothetical protein
MLSRVLGVLMMGVPFAAALAARRPSAPTHGVRLEHTWIPSRDGTAAVSYPWGRFDHSERLIHETDDAHSELASVQGDSEYIQIVKNHILTWRGRLNVVSNAYTFFYKYTRTLVKVGAVVKTKTWKEPFPRVHQ